MCNIYIDVTSCYFLLLWTNTQKVWTDGQT